MKHQTDLSEAKRAILARMLAGNNAARPIESIAPRPVDSPVPLSAGQRQVWLHEQVIGDPLLYT
ncbi:MAG: hypothetical protein M3N02_07700, partial [Pseudomonadota bacterium]|nr:hypothetical protein [Pseudomonadota bacterium]